MEYLRIVGQLQKVYLTDNGNARSWRKREMNRKNTWSNNENFYKLMSDTPNKKYKNLKKKILKES